MGFEAPTCRAPTVQSTDRSIAEYRRAYSQLSDALMDHQFVARAMCKITEEMLWRPRKSWALKHNPTASLRIRVGNGKATYLSSNRDLAKGANMTLTYGVMMVASKTNPDKMGKWLTAREIKQRGYFGGELTLLNVLAHTMAHEFGHFVQVILGRSYSGSVHNPEFYNILDRIHSGGEANKIREALHEHCMQLNIDLTRIRASDGTKVLPTGSHAAGERVLTMRDVRKGQLLAFLDRAMAKLGPVRVHEKRRTRIVVELVADTKRKWLAYPAGFSRELD